MAVEVRFSAQATIELDQAIAWYEIQRQNLGIEFLDAIENAVSKIAENPERFPSNQLPIRHFTLRRFPFTIFYEIRENTIWIAAIWHQKRNQ
jgi:plasmid stabilization system protein ParE